MFKKIFVALILAALFVLPSAVLAPYTDLGTNLVKTEDLVKLLLGPEVPSEFLASPYKILQFLVFPFIALLVIIYGILEQVRIFRRKSWINAVLAFLIAAMAGPTGGLVYLVRFVFVGYGWYGFLIFAGLLFVGTGLWGWGTFRIWKPKEISRAEAAKRFKTLRELDERINYLERRANSPFLSKDERDAAFEEWKRLEDKRETKFG